MLTVDLAINGVVIGRMSVHNDGPAAGLAGATDEQSIYRWRLTPTTAMDGVPRPIAGLVTHPVQDGAWALVRRVLEAAAPMLQES